MMFMTAETIICMVIVAIASAPMIILGIVQYRSKEPVGFWTGKEPPRMERITDVKAYNQKHGIMWIIYGAGFFLGFALAVPLGEKLALIAAILGIGGIFVMIAYHNRLNRKYYREEGKP